MSTDFQDQRVKNIADVVFADDDGEGANAEWWDMLASIDRELSALRIIASMTYPARFVGTSADGTKIYGGSDDASRFARKVRGGA